MPERPELPAGVSLQGVPTGVSDVGEVQSLPEAADRQRFESALESRPVDGQAQDDRSQVPTLGTPTPSGAVPNLLQTCPQRWRIRLNPRDLARDRSPWCDPQVMRQGSLQRKSGPWRLRLQAPGNGKFRRQ